MSNSRGLPIALYGVITLLSVVTLGLTASMMSIYMGRGLPRFYHSNGLTVVTSEHAVLLCFVASIFTTLNGVYRTIEAFKVSSGSVIGHRIAVGISFILFLGGASLLTSYKAGAAAAPACLPPLGDAVSGYGFDRCGSQRLRDDSIGNKLIEILFGFVWAETGLLLSAVILSFTTQARTEENHQSTESIHDVVEKA